MNTSNRKKTKNDRGSLLVYALIVTSASLIVLTAMLQYVTSQIRYGLYAASREEAFQIAESGVSYYRWYLAHATDGRTAQQVEDFWSDGDPLGVSAPYEAEYYDPSGAAVGKYRLEIVPPEKGSTIVTVKATGWTYKYPDSVRIIQARLRRPAWSEYTMLSNSFIRFGSGTEVYGKVFANGGVHFDGVAHNAVYSAVSSYYDTDYDVRAIKPGVWTSWNSGYNSDMASDVFLAGKDYPVTDKDFSSVTADLSLMKSTAQAAGKNACSSTACYFDTTGSGWRIVLNADGTFRIINVQSYTPSTGAIWNYDSSGWKTFAIPDDGVIFVEGNVWLEGTLSGKRLTVVAANLKSFNQSSVFIRNDIKYGGYDGSAVLGVIAQDDVSVIKDSEDDLRLDGAYLAQNGRVGRPDYGKYDIKDTITVYGAIASNQRYGFAWSDSLGHSWGYLNRNLYYDSNLAYFPPPYFPTGDEYLMDLWEEL